MRADRWATVWFMAQILWSAIVSRLRLYLPGEKARRAEEDEDAIAVIRLLAQHELARHEHDEEALSNEYEREDGTLVSTTLHGIDERQEIAMDAVLRDLERDIEQILGSGVNIHLRVEAAIDKPLDAW